MPIKDLSSNVTREIVAQPLSPQKPKPTSSERLASVSPFPFGSRGIKHRDARRCRSNRNALVRPASHCSQSPVSFRTGFFIIVFPEIACACSLSIFQLILTL